METYFGLAIVEWKIVAVLIAMLCSVPLVYWLTNKYNNDNE